MKTPGTRVLIPFLLLPLLASTTACFTVASPRITEMRNRIAGQLDVDMHKEMALSFGRLSLGLARGIAHAAVNDPEGREGLAVLHGLHRVEVGVYSIESSAAHGAKAELPQRIERAMSQDHWTAAVRSTSESELTWVYFRFDRHQKAGDPALRGVFVIALDDDELTLVRLQGRLDRALSAAIALSRSYSEGEQPL